jgi:hypothetical protein
MTMENPGLLGITRLRVPRPFVEDAVDHLASSGALGLEALALWAGAPDGDTFHVQSTIIPAQRACRTSDGHYYVVEGAELQRINRHLFRFGMMLGAQLHSHAGEAYHSETDDAYPIVAVLGGASVVIPDFALGSPEPDAWAVYRLLPDSGWTALEGGQISEFISIV